MECNRIQCDAMECNRINGTAQFRIEEYAMTRGGGEWRQQAFFERGDGPAQAGASFFSNTADVIY